MAKTTPTSIRLGDDLRTLLATTATNVKLKITDTHRQAVLLGCPELERRLKNKSK